MKNEEEIRKKAHEFYEKRGRKDGYDLDDWLRAEIVICKNPVKWAELANIFGVIIALAALTVSFCSYKGTLVQSEKQLEQAKELYELQNRPVLVIKNAGWYPAKTLADVGIRIKIPIYNGGKTIPSEARVIKDIFLRIKTDTLERFPNFKSDMIPSEQVDVSQDKRIKEYIAYREKPFKDIKEYIFRKKEQTNGPEIIEHFSEGYKKEGYVFEPYSDLASRDCGMIIPGETVWKETGRSISIPRFEDEILNPGGDIIIFYYAIEYLGPLKMKKYITHYIGCYESMHGQKEMRGDNYPFIYSTISEKEVDNGK